MINSFKGEHSFLSNFYIAPFSIGGQAWLSVEHYFQATKCNTLQDWERIRVAKTPGQAKALGQKVACRPDWEIIKEDVMLCALQAKFTVPTLRAKLLATGEEQLVEGNVWHDNYWGACVCSKCVNIKGKNRLGALLMQVRHELHP